MKGKIINIDWKKGIVTVLTETREQTIFEILSDDNFENGDELFWKEYNPLGHCIIENHTKDEKCEVFFQDY